MCHNVYLTESRADGKALQLRRSPRVLRRGMGSVDLVAVFPCKENKLCYQASDGADSGRVHKVAAGSSEGLKLEFYYLKFTFRLTALRMWL